MTHPMQKKAKQKGPLDSFMRQKPEVVVQLRKEGKLRQSNVTEKFDKERRAMVCQYIGRFFYQAGIPFNVARMDSFKWMIEAIGQYGPNLQPPSYHELRVPILKKEVELTNDMMKSHKDRWKRHGCSIMSDGWTSRTNRTLINFLVNCPVGTMFVKSIDASLYVKTSEKLFKVLDDFVEYFGEENVVQVVTDNGSNFKAAGRLLELKKPNLYWTPCAAHCLDLILEDIGKIPKVSRTIERAISLTGYIYNHVGVLNMMRTFTNQRELVRPGKTRFCTSYLSLKCIHQQKIPLRSMFTSQEWFSSKWSKEAKGKRAMETVLMPSFWTSVVYILKVMGPLVRVLRLVDNEKRLAMGYIYEAMDRAKEAIQTSFNGKEEKYKDIFKIIDERWDCQLHQPLHAAAHFLDPEFFYDNQNLEYDQEVTSGLITCISRLVKDFDTQKRIMAELTIYKRAEGLFGVPLAIRTRKTRAPAEWWSTYGSSTPNLQQLAIRILGLTCSASGCERNWSVFEQAFFNLEYVEVGPKEAKWFRDCINNYRMHNLREFCLRDMSSIDDIYWFLHRIPNLESLCLRYCQFNELMPYENMGAEEKMGNVVQLKNLWLWSLPSLKNIGLERDPVLQRVERLSLFNCPKLIKLAASFVSFIHLRYLNVSRCIKLKNLMTPSTARSLVQLTTMKVSTCFDMKEIVAREESEEETTIVIVFRKLTTLELEYLGDLTSFCSSKNLVFDFPSLEKLTMTGCPGMKIFTEGVTRAPKLQKVSVSGKEEGKWYWEGDLNTTIEKASEHAPNYVYAAAKMFLMAGLDAFTEDE